MKTFTIPFNYKVNATIKVQAKDLDDAIAQVSAASEVKLGYCQLVHGMNPMIASEADAASIKIDESLAEDLNPKQRYTVTITRTQTVQVDVYAHSAEDAEDAAIDIYDENEIDDSSWSDEELVAGDATPYQE